MIERQRYDAALKALQRLIVHANSEAHEAGAHRVADLLNDMELLPEFIGDDSDRTSEWVEALDGIASMYPSCRYIVDEFSQTTVRTS